MLNRSSSTGFRFLGVFFLGTLVGLYGCKTAVAPGGKAGGADANNLKHVKCKKYLDGGPVEIAIDSSNKAIHDEDQIVFVCKDEIVRWNSSADPNVASYTITFKNNAWPFKPTPKPLASNNNGVTPDQTVAGVMGKYAECYEYTITVKRKDGTTVQVDPHVMPM